MAGAVFLGLSGLITAVDVSVGLPTLCFSGRFCSSFLSCSRSRTYKNSGNPPGSWQGTGGLAAAVLELQVSHATQSLVSLILFKCGPSLSWHWLLLGLRAWSRFGLWLKNKKEEVGWNQWVLFSAYYRVRWCCSLSKWVQEPHLETHFIWIRLHMVSGLK